MSRGFGSTFGAGTSDVITTTAALAFATKTTISVWAYINGAGGSSNGLILSAGTSPVALALRLNGSTSAFTGIYPWSVSRLGFSFTTPVGTGVWQHILMTYDGSSTANNPVVYINGVSVSVTRTIAPSGTYGITLASTLIGNTTTLNWDGMLAHFALWNGVILSQAEISALTAGANPRTIESDSLALYFPFDGVNKPEPEVITAAANTITGTRLGTSEPPVAAFLVEEDLTLIGTQLYDVLLDCGISFEILGGINAERRSRLENLGTVVRDASPLMDFVMSVPAAERGIVLETLNSIARNEPATVEILASIAADRSLRQEFLAGIAKATPALLESLGTSSLGLKAPFEFLGASGLIQHDEAMPFEVLASSAAAIKTQIEWLATVSDDPGSTPAEGGYGMSSFGDSSLAEGSSASPGKYPIEILASSNADSSGGLDFIGTFGSADFVMPLEWYGEIVSPPNRVFVVPPRVKVFKAPL